MPSNALVYSSNNSGGNWWLTDEDWFALEDAGWIVHWQHPREQVHGDIVHKPSKYSYGGHDHSYSDELIAVERPDKDSERFLRALATSAALHTTDPEAGIAQWEAITGQSSLDQGCNCCGPPHNFTFYNAEGTSLYSGIEIVHPTRTWN